MRSTAVNVSCSHSSSCNAPLREEGNVISTSARWPSPDPGHLVVSVVRNGSNEVHMLY